MGNSPADEMVVIDLETPGLDEREGTPVEVALVVARFNEVTGDLEPLDEGVSFVVHCERDEFERTAEPFVVEMHTANGLLDAAEKSMLTLGAAETLALQYLAYHGFTAESEEKPPLMNNNSPFERAWMREHLPKLNACLHYRNLDVSSLKEYLRRRHPHVLAGAPRKPDSHRAMSDVFACINELEYYDSKLFSVPHIPARELTEFFTEHTTPGNVLEFGAAGRAVVCDHGTPDQAEAYALRLLAAVAHHREWMADV